MARQDVGAVTLAEEADDGQRGAKPRPEGSKAKIMMGKNYKRVSGELRPDDRVFCRKCGQEHRAACMLAMAACLVCQRSNISACDHPKVPCGCAPG